VNAQEPNEGSQVTGRDLVLLSLCETCKYMGLRFLDFLRSGGKDIRCASPE